MGDIPTENFLKRHQHWLLAIFSALLLFFSFPNVNLYPFAWIAMVPFFIALTRATGWKSAFWIGYVTGFLFFAGLLPAIALLYPYANIFATMIAYLLLVGYTGSLFCRFRRTDEVCTGAFRRTIPACRCLYLDGIGMGAELDDNRIPVGKHRLLAMEQFTGYTGRFSLQRTRHQFRDCALQCQHRYPPLQPPAVATRNSCFSASDDFNNLLFQLRCSPTPRR